MRRILAPSILLVAVLAVTGCTAGTSSDSSGAPMVQQAPASGEAGGDSGVARDESSTSEDDRAVVTTGSMTVTADDPIDAAGEAVAIAEGAGGRVDARTENAPVGNDSGSATLVLRLPAQTLTATIDALKDLGEVEHVALTSSDVTTETQDLDARVRALRASVERLTALLSAAADTDVLIKLETAISDRQGELESLEAQQRSLADQVSLSRLELNLISPTDAPADEPDDFLSGLLAGWTALTGFVGSAVVGLGVALPWLASIAVLAAIALAIVRLTRRRRGEAAAAGGDAAEAVLTDSGEVRPTSRIFGEE